MNYLKKIIAEANVLYRRARDEEAGRDERHKQEQEEASEKLRRFRQEAGNLDF